jgi:hypothetical protein
MDEAYPPDGSLVNEVVLRGGDEGTAAQRSLVPTG